MFDEYLCPSMLDLHNFLIFLKSTTRRTRGNECRCVCVHSTLLIYCTRSVTDYYRYPPDLMELFKADIILMGHHGVSIDWNVAKGVAVAVLRLHDKENLVGTGKGQIALSRQWLQEKLHSFNLTPRVGGTDAQTIPPDWELQVKNIIAKV